MHTVIIGNGISGVTTARYLRKHSDQNITIISKETPHFYSRTALMYIYMGHMRYEDTKPYEDDFWNKNKIDLLYDEVLQIDFKSKTLQMNTSEQIRYDNLVLALGSKPNKFGWKGQDLNGVQGLYAYQDLKLLEKNTTEHSVKRAVIVGGGLIGVELAEMLLSRNIKVTFLVRESHFWGNILPKQQSEMIAKHMINDHHVDLRLHTELDEVMSDQNGRVKEIITKSGEKIPCELVGLTAGVSPNIEFLKQSVLKTNRGVIVDHFLKTNIDNVYALGDCAEFQAPAGPGRRTIEQVWYTGKMMGMALGKTLAGTPTKYSPSHWFNSAKFFDIEYQTYGWVGARLKENEEAFYWEHPKEYISLYMVFDKQTSRFIGINSFGFRLRHALFEKWLNEKYTIDQVIASLKDANFDPEFYKSVETDILSTYNKTFNKSITLKKKSLLNIFGR